MKSIRDDFPEPIKKMLAARVGYRCSSPSCRAPISGPHDDPLKSVNLGVAAHISAAAPGGPRFDPAMTPEQRSDIENGICLCQNCAKLVDNDPERFTADVMRLWKTSAEKEAEALVGKTAAVPVGPPVITDKWVGSEYIHKAEIAKNVEQQGYKLTWWSANEESQRLDLEGWEYVIVPQRDGTQCRLKIHDSPIIGGYLVLMKKKLVE